MADASCSGSTPFKRLVDHQARDVSHHQDRLVNQSPGFDHRAFRSAAQNGQAQQGFEAFMNGTGASPTLSGMPHPNDSAARLSAHAAALRHAPTPEFFSSPAPSHPELAFQLGNFAAAGGAAGVSDWAADFARFSGQPQQQRPVQPAQHMGPAGPAMQFNQATSAFQPNFQAAFGFPAGGAFGSPALANQQQQSEYDQEMARWRAAHGNAGGGASMEQVDAVMEQMARELELNEAALADGETTAAPAQAEPVTAQDVVAEAQGQQDQHHQTHFTDLETPEIGNLSLESRLEDQLPISDQNATAIPEEMQSDEQQPTPASRSAVSEAAERLLESVRSEDGEKWKNSTFLSLMRDFRDGRKDIVDNEIRHMDGEEGEGEAESAATA